MICSLDISFADTRQFFLFFLPVFFFLRLIYFSLLLHLSVVPISCFPCLQFSFTFSVQMSSSSCKCLTIGVCAHKSVLILLLSSMVYKSSHSQEHWCFLMNVFEKALDAKKTPGDCIVHTNSSDSMILNKVEYLLIYRKLEIFDKSHPADSHFVYFLRCLSCFHIKHAHIL